MKEKYMKLKPNADAITLVNDEISLFLHELEIPVKCATKVSVAVDEIVSNIVHYSHADWFSINVKATDDEVEVTLLDNGIEYNPLLKADPDVTLSAEEREIGGLGIFMTKKMMDSLSYFYENDENKLVMVKKYTD